MLNNYVLELKQANLGSNVNFVTKREDVLEFHVFQRIYIFLTSIIEGFTADCRNILGLVGSLLKALMKGMLPMAVVRDENNQIFPVAWAIVEKETTES